MKDKTEIVIRTRSRTVIRSRGRPVRRWCAFCRKESPMLSPNEAACFFRTTAREIFRLAEAGEIHFHETTDGALFVCGDSCREIFL